MSYFLKKINKSKGVYLSIYETTYNSETKLSNNKSYKTLGYVKDLKTSLGVDDPIAYFNEEVKKLNLKTKEEKKRKVGEKPITKNIGYFLIKSILNTLNVKKDLNLFGENHKFQIPINDFVETMIFCQIVKPASKYKNANEIIPSLQNVKEISEDQIYRMINFIGSNYKKYIEVFNKHLSDYCNRNFSNLFFDCTNYYFEIDSAFEDKQKGPSKEGRKEPIIGQALLLDGDRIPLAMEMYPGNESEKPYIRKLIEESKCKYNVKGRTIQVADKGLNCAKNIFFASKEANDGYIFSKSVHGKNLSEQEKKWVLLDDNSVNMWHEVNDAKGNLIYKYKECVDTFKYSFTDENGQKIEFEMKEKRVVSYNPKLAKKQIAEINKQIEKIRKLNTLKSIKRVEYGDAIKYVMFTNKDGEIDESIPSLNQSKIDEDKKFAGYNLLVSSEINTPADEIYKTYHSLREIEESFRLLKYYLEARPVYLQNKESIYGHFLICYLSLFCLRVLQKKIFNDELNSNDIFNFIRQFNLTENDSNYISNILMSDTLRKIKKVTQLNSIDNYYIDEKDISHFLSYEFD